MDFSKFRDSGDLSDIVVVVEGQENNLHRFPLYAKSDYFCSLARGPSMSQSPSAASKARVELAGFPGGQAVFSVVADFCYSMAPQVSQYNVVQLRCAAHVLRMAGPGNLAQAADRYLQDILTSAKLSRSPGPLVTLLLHSAAVGQPAADCGVVDACTDALVDTLLRSPTKFSTTTSSHSSSSSSSSSQPGSAFTALQGSAFTPTKPSPQSAAPRTSLLAAGRNLADEDRALLKNLHQLPEEWFANLLRKGLDRGVVQTLLADMAVSYVSEAIDKEGMGDTTSTTTTSSNGINGHSTPIQQQSGEGEEEEDAAQAVEDVEDLDKDIDSLGEEIQEVGVGGGAGAGAGVGVVVGECPVVPDREVDLGHLLDTVLTTLPEEAYHVPSLTLEWLTKTLRVATARGCKCRAFLVKIAADMLTRLPAEELCLVSPSVLHDIVLEARVDDSQAERACVLVDTYLAEMAKKGVLTAETFRLLANATPAAVRRNHDNLYEVLEYVLKSEKDSLTAEQRQELLSTINLHLVSEETLQRALDSDLVAAEPVARAALKLCSALRSELESVKYIAQMQEEEVHKLQAIASPDASPRTPAYTSALKIDSDSGFSDSNQDSKAGSGDRATDQVRAAQSVLSTARSKLAMPLYTGHRPYLPSSSTSTSSTSSPHHHSSSSLYPSTATALEQDIGLQEELEYRLDRSSFRSLEPRVRTRHFPSYGGHTSGSSAAHHHHHHRSTYFPYSNRY